MATEEGRGRPAVAKDTNKGHVIEETLSRLDEAVGEVESLARRITGEPSVDSKERGESNRGVGCLLSDLPSDLSALDSRLASARVAIQDALY